MICKVLGLFANTLTAEDKYSLLNKNKLFQDLQMQLSQKQINIFRLVFAFWKLRLNFESFQKKDEPQNSCIFELTDSEKGG